MAVARPEEIFLFWKDAGPDKWFTSDPAFDVEVRARFMETYEAGLRGELDGWERSAYGAFALVILLDQFPRNMFRASSRAFATDALALSISQHALAAGWDRQLTQQQRLFLYMPFQHSENRAVQARSIELFTQLGLADNLDYARRHKDIVDRFGRFPHRNAVLGRQPTTEELEFVATHRGF
jgi:uncharacterized protein (DUF924 family)